MVNVECRNTSTFKLFATYYSSCCMGINTYIQDQIPRK